MRIRRRYLVLGICLFLTAFGTYLWVLYGQLEKSFAQQDQFVPTRIYSDVTRIAPPELRSKIEARLFALGYSIKRTQDTTSFKLRAADYPTYLVPDKHPVLEAEGQLVTLGFALPLASNPESDQASPAPSQTLSKDPPLQSIQIGSQMVADLYLEPELVATLSRGAVKEIRSRVEFQDVPALVWKAIIAIEDQHFLDHKGFDPRGLARAVFVNIKTLSFAQGGSTLTQQLVKNLMARRSKNIFKKINELFLALLLEVKFDKEQILERYLNEVYLGQIGSLEVHGVAEGAEHFFGKKIDELNLAEIALMAGLIRGPGVYSPYRYRERAMDRQKLVLRKMVETSQIAEEEMTAALKQPIRLAPPKTVANKAPFFVDFVKAELIRLLKDRITEQEVTSAGFRVYTTLDMPMNQVAQKSVAEGINDLEKKLKVMAPDRLEGALAAVDHHTGYIRALVGGRNYAQSNFNRILNMKRQIGSTFKPFVYLAAFNQGEDPNGVPYSPGHPAEDAPWKLVFDRGKQTWEPRNYDPDYLGWINYRTALSHSINTVAAKLAIEVGLDEVIKTARAVGIESELPKVPSLSLGVAELSPVELLRAYSTLANRGNQDELTVIRGITLDDGKAYARFVYNPKNVYPSAPIDLLTDVLQSTFADGTARSAQSMGFNRPAAGKTGTTSHHRDSWFAGFTPEITSVVWVGMDQAPLPVETANDAKSGSKQKKPRIALTGAGSALPIWVKFMKEALAGRPATTFGDSAGLAQIKIDIRSGKAAYSDCPEMQTALEKFMPGHEPSSSSCEQNWPASTAETNL